MVLLTLPEQVLSFFLQVLARLGRIGAREHPDVESSQQLGSAHAILGGTLGHALAQARGKHFEQLMVGEVAINRFFGGRRADRLGMELGAEQEQRAQQRQAS